MSGVDPAELVLFRPDAAPSEVVDRVRQRCGEIVGQVQVCTHQRPQPDLSWNKDPPGECIFRMRDRWLGFGGRDPHRPA